MTTKRTFLLASLLMLFCLAAPQLSAQPSTTDRSKPNKIVFDGDMAALLAQVAEIHKVTIGLETAPNQPRTNVKVDFWFASVDDVVEGIIKAAPGYQWRNQGGFIDVYPTDISCPLLETALSEFEVNNQDWLAATETLTNLPEVERELNVLGLTRRSLDKQTPPATLFSVNLRNVSFRRALHEITKSSQNSFWMFKRYGNRGQDFSISNAPF
jgi:hypothetical protein